MAKRNPESDPFAVLAREWANDRDTLLMVREWAVSVRAWPQPYDDFDTGYTSAARSVLTILNGERKEKKP